MSYNVPVHSEAETQTIKKIINLKEWFALLIEKHLQFIH